MRKNERSALHGVEPRPATQRSSTAEPPAPAAPARDPSVHHGPAEARATDSLSGSVRWTYRDYAAILEAELILLAAPGGRRESAATEVRSDGPAV